MSAATRRRLHAEARDALVRALARHAPGRLALVSAFGPGSAVLIELLSGLGARLPVVFVDTLHHFPETLAHVERVRARYELDLRVARPAGSLAAFERLYGPRLWERDLDRYQRLTKVEPFRRAVAPFGATVTGRRRDQSPTRARLALVEPGRPERVNPLARWTAAEVWRFIRERALPYNPLHDLGYPSIGDAPLTSPTAPDEHERAGRWRGTARLECGIHRVQHP